MGSDGDQPADPKRPLQSWPCFQPCTTYGWADMGEPQWQGNQTVWRKSEQTAGQRGTENSLSGFLLAGI